MANILDKFGDYEHVEVGTLVDAAVKFHAAHRELEDARASFELRVSGAAARAEKVLDDSVYRLLAAAYGTVEPLQPLDVISGADVAESIELSDAEVMAGRVLQ